MTSCGCGRKRKGVAYRIEHHFRYAPMPEAHPSAMLASAVRAISALSVCPAVVELTGIYVPCEARRWWTFEIGGRGRNCRKGLNETNWRKLDHCLPLPESGNGE